jgi:hypothetical protein
MPHMIGNAHLDPIRLWRRLERSGVAVPAHGIVTIIPDEDKTHRGDAWER